MVVCPAYLCLQWMQYLEQHGADAHWVSNRKQLATDARVRVISYEMLRNLLKAEVKIPEMTAVVFDEAHRLRTRDSQITKLATRWVKNTKYVWMLTGTPMYSGAENVFPLLRIIDPVEFKGYWKFVEEHMITQQTPYAVKVLGPKDPWGFVELLKPYMLRRNIGDLVELDLPPLVSRDVPVELGAASSKLYRSMVRQAAIDENIGTEYHNMIRYLSKDPAKIAAVRGVLSDLGGRVAVIAHYRDTVTHLQQVLKAYAHHGGMTTAARAEALSSFHDDPHGVLVATNASLGEGLNLQYCNHLVWYEHPHTHGTLTQVRARFHRSGQAHTVDETHVVTNHLDGVIKEKVLTRDLQITDVYSYMRGFENAP